MPEVDVGRARFPKALEAPSYPEVLLYSKFFVRLHSLLLDCRIRLGTGPDPRVLVRVDRILRDG